MEVQKPRPSWEKSSEKTDWSLVKERLKAKKCLWWLMNPQTRLVLADSCHLTVKNATDEEYFDPAMDFVT